MTTMDVPSDEPVPRVKAGATGSGARHEVGDALGVCCPDKLEKIQDKVDDLRTDDTVRR